MSSGRVREGLPWASRFRPSCAEASTRMGGCVRARVYSRQRCRGRRPRTTRLLLQIGPSHSVVFNYCAAVETGQLREDSWEGCVGPRSALEGFGGSSCWRDADHVRHRPICISRSGPLIDYYFGTSTVRRPGSGMTRQADPSLQPMILLVWFLV
jgi:hypothetical protein